MPICFLFLTNSDKTHSKLCATLQANLVDNKRRTRDRDMADDRRSLDAVSVSSLGPNATTIKVPYNQRQSVLLAPKEHRPIVVGDIEDEEERMLSNDEEAEKQQVFNKKDHYDYKTVIATVHSANNKPTATTMPTKPTNHQNIVETYNVRVIHHNSPFLNEKQQPIKSVNDLSSSIARLELLSSELGSNLKTTSKQRQQFGGDDLSLENNNESSFNLSDFYNTKQKSGTTLVDSGIATSSLDDDAVSLISSCSLRSSRTYNICVKGHQPEVEANQLDDNVESENEPERNKENKQDEEEEEEGDEKKPAAWVFDLRDNSSTAIIAPPRPKRPESPKIDAKTEELAQARGGRAYYLELIEKEGVKREPERPRPNSMNSLYSRWSSHNALNKYQQQQQTSQTQSRRLPKTTTKPASKPKATKPVDETRKSRQIVPASIIKPGNFPRSSSLARSNRKVEKSAEDEPRRQLPFSGAPLGNRSKSSSCLLGTAAKPSKYSIYGGLRKPDEDKKPVPRLSYSRAIGPKSQRQLNAQSKTPSRYLKMK